jgi:hypothetical protein
VRITRSVNGDEPDLPAAAHQHQALILHRPAKPSRERTFKPKLLQAFERLRKRILNFVFCVSPVAEQHERAAQANGKMPLGQFTKGSRIAGLRQPNEFLIRPIRGDSFTRL